MFHLWNSELQRYDKKADTSADIFDILETFHRSRESNYVERPERRVLHADNISKGQNGKRNAVVTDSEFEIIKLKEGGLTFAEISKEMGYTIPKVTGMYYRGGGRLAKMSEHYRDWIEQHNIDVDQWLEEVGV